MTSPISTSSPLLTEWKALGCPEVSVAEREPAYLRRTCALCGHRRIGIAELVFDGPTYYICRPCTYAMLGLEDEPMPRRRARTTGPA